MRLAFMMAALMLAVAAAPAQAVTDRVMSNELRRLSTRAADLSAACLAEIRETGSRGDACTRFRAYREKTEVKRRRYRRQVDRAARAITRNFTEQTLGFTAVSAEEQAILNNRAAAQAARQRLRMNKRRIEKLTGD